MNEQNDGGPARLTKDQAAIIGAFTGIACGPFSDIHGYAEKVLGRPVWTHQFASEALSEELREASRADFIAICYEDSHRAMCAPGMQEGVL